MKTKSDRKRKRGAAVACTDLLGFHPAFMVWVEGTYNPTHRHGDLGDAMAEAERLCRKENKPAFVLADLYKCEPSAPPVKWSPSRIKRENPNVRRVSHGAIDK